MRTRKTLSRLKRHSAVTIVSGMMAFQFGGCIPNELSAVETTTVTLDGRQVVTSLINSIVLAPIQLWVEDSVNSFFDGLLDDE